MVRCFIGLGLAIIFAMLMVVVVVVMPMRVGVSDSIEVFVNMQVGFIAPLVLGMVEAHVGLLRA